MFFEQVMRCDMRTAANLIVAAMIISTIGLLPAPSYAEFSGPTGVSGNKVAVPPGGKVTVNGNTATISAGNSSGRWSCTCSGTGTDAGCVVLHDSDYIRCGKRAGDTTCKQGCVLSAYQSRTLSPGAIPKATLTPASPGGTAVPSAGSNAPATR